MWRGHCGGATVVWPAAGGGRGAQPAWHQDGDDDDDGDNKSRPKPAGLTKSVAGHGLVTSSKACSEGHCEDYFKKPQDPKLDL
ncbi:hypothetical protein GUJ93_ZPchr0009g492 [Zizania palustris]|uniref:Uncharacterized protein n=1 Tax=Zizania palustris TaxID=103762 RepID=A0A8J5RMI6_ZIZPA|nr:hypothetical protein GUJ93_ZPchr0009g492 [Zizania palustris]